MFLTKRRLNPNGIVLSSSHLVSLMRRRTLCSFLLSFLFLHLEPSLACPTADYDGNDRVDLADFRIWFDCAAGPDTAPIGINCPANIDGDQDVDLFDLSKLQLEFRSVVGSLFPGVGFPAGNNPRGVVAFDMNGDNFLDLVVVNELGTPGVSVLLNSGTGYFEPVPNPAIGGGGLYVSGSDLDNDGDIDIVTSQGSSISVFRNDGTGVLSPPQPITVGAGTKRIEVHDLDADGDSDIAVVAYDVDKVAVLLNSGNATFAPPALYTVGNGPWNLTVTDFDGDQDLDMAVVDRLADRITVLRNNGTAIYSTIATYIVGDSPVGIRSADLDSDGDSDLVVSNMLSSTISVLLNDGLGSFASLEPLPANSFGLIVCMDFNLDGHVDILAKNGYMYVYLNQGDASFAAYQRLTTEMSISGETNWVFADLDADDDIDLAGTSVLHDTVSIYFGLTDKHFESQATYPLGDDAWRITANDFDGDGDIDLASTVSGSTTASFYVLSNNGNGTFSDPVPYTGFSLSALITSGDVDGDGDIDLVSPSRLRRNNGDGTFGAPENLSLTSDPFAIETSDFDSDGDFDLAITNGSADIVKIALNDGAGHFSSVANYNLGNSPYWDFVVADFDNDGDQDLAVPTFHESISVLLNNGNAVFAQQVSYGTGCAGCHPTSIAASDLDGDGDLDLATTNTDTNNVTILANAGDATFSVVGTIVVWNDPNFIRSADFDSDGDNDLVISHRFIYEGVNSASRLTLLLNDGTGVFPDSVPFPVWAGAKSFATEDFDLDGDLDLAVTFDQSERVGILLNRCVPND